MNFDRDFDPRRVRLPGAGGGESDERGGWDPRAEAGRERRDSLRRVRRFSNWTAAALIAGTGAATVALASNALHLGTTASASSTGSSAATTSQGTTAPSVGGPVATTGGSGTTVTTTRRVVNGHVVVTQVRTPAHYSDN